MLKDNFYILIDLKKDVNALSATIAFNEQHAIFQGHFPGQPVVPGVCLMQIAKEILGYSLDKKLQLIKADDIKFLSMLDPYEQKNVDVKIDYAYPGNDLLDANIIFQKEGIIFCKIRCSLALSELSKS